MPSLPPLNPASFELAHLHAAGFILTVKYEYLVYLLQRDLTVPCRDPNN